MNQSHKWMVGVALGGLLLTGCVSKVTEKEQYSGFLPNYDGLQEVTTPSGQKAMRWIAPGFQASAYDTVVFKQLDLYPAPKPTERVNLQTLQDPKDPLIARLAQAASATSRPTSEAFRMLADCAPPMSCVWKWIGRPISCRSVLTSFSAA